MLGGSDTENENMPSVEEFEKLHKMFKLATTALKVFIVYLNKSVKRNLTYLFRHNILNIAHNMNENFLLQSRDTELTEAIDEIAANPPSSEMQEVVKELEDEREKLKKENKDLKNQIKKFKRAKTGQGAIEVVRE